MSPHPQATTLHLTPLMTALYFRQRDIVKMLLDRGASPNQVRLEVPYVTQSDVISLLSVLHNPFRTRAHAVRANSHSTHKHTKHTPMPTHGALTELFSDLHVRTRIRARTR
jgi:ankyrin repeat protein